MKGVLCMRKAAGSPRYGAGSLLMCFDLLVD
jgi:hypothetical protein